MRETTGLESVRENCSFAPLGLALVPLSTHRLRGGLHSYAASRLNPILLREEARRVWQRRFYDFNVWSQGKEIEKLKYMHRNPVVRGLVEEPGPWCWSSFRSYAYGEAGMVRINDWSWWEDEIRAGAS